VPPVRGVRRTFHDDDLQARFAEHGYVVLPFLDAHDIQHFRVRFDEWYPDHRGDFETTALNEHDDPHHLAVHEALAGWFQDRVDVLFDDHGIRHAYFMCKRGGLPEQNVSEVVLHQDWTYVDEPTVRGPLMWCPLVDVDEHNGWLQVVPGSHRFPPGPRGTGDMPWAFREVEAELRAALRSIPVSAGDVIVYDGALIHASPPNRTPVDRPVIGLGLAPREATMVHFHSTDGRWVERYEVEDAFYLDHRLGDRPSAHLQDVARSPLPVEPVSSAQLAGWLAAAPPGPEG
jgi:ectoine hydroxylase-related dioxygenase (phytanoyl-CoA dioxygenase family)